jgi:uncharacterized protein (TIGR02996 family)
MAEHDAFLRAIAESPDDNGPRLIFADWLTENDDPDRAEFVRTQCELASAKVSGKRREALRHRERELLETHREAWCGEFGVAVEDVSFERGLIAGVRVSKWTARRVLGPKCAPRLGTVTELDLSGLQIGDDGLAALAGKARLPALRKLVLGDNGITDAGVAALAAATELPRLETVYLFANPVGPRARATLERSAGFRLKYLDLGERAEGYCMSAGETEIARRHYVRTKVLPLVLKTFAKYESLRSAALCVAQYWADEADDAVHSRLVVSELFEPQLEGVAWYSEEPRPDPNLPTTFIKSEYGEGSSSMIDIWRAEWDDNSGAIPLWAAFAPEEGHQEYDSISEVYSPAVLFYRHGGYEILPMLRPHLDGVQPQWG